MFPLLCDDHLYLLSLVPTPNRRYSLFLQQRPDASRQTWLITTVRNQAQIYCLPIIHKHRRPYCITIAMTNKKGLHNTGNSVCDRPANYSLDLVALHSDIRIETRSWTIRLDSDALLRLRQTIYRLHTSSQTFKFSTDAVRSVCIGGVIDL